MNQASHADVQTLRDRIKQVLDEDLNEANLTAIWPSIETEWLGLFPETQALLSHLRQRTSTFQHTDKALETLLAVCDKHLENLSEAAGYDKEAADLKKAAQDSLKKYSELLKAKS